MKKPKILIVDDDMLTRRSYARFLRRKGELTEAHSGGTGVEAAEENPPDIIVSDYNMPGMTGPEMVAEMRQRGISPPVIFITGDSRDMVESETKRLLGATGFRIFRKPMEISDLLESVDEMLEEAAKNHN